MSLSFQTFSSQIGCHFGCNNVSSFCYAKAPQIQQKVFRHMIFFVLDDITNAGLMILLSQRCLNNHTPRLGLHLQQSKNENGKLFPIKLCLASEIAIHNMAFPMRSTTYIRRRSKKNTRARLFKTNDILC